MNKQRGAQDESLQSTECRNNDGGRNSKKRNVQPNGNNRMHPFGRSGGSSPPPPPQDKTLFRRVQALESSIHFLQTNNQHLITRMTALKTQSTALETRMTALKTQFTALETLVTALEVAGRQCICGAITGVIN